MKKALILINERAGTGRAGTSVMRIISEAARAGFEPVVFPIIPGAGLTSESLIATHGKDVELIICSGGDGTLNHVVNGIMHLERRPRLAFVPSGSTNDFARGIGIPSNKARAIDVALYGGVFAYDVGSMNDKYFNYVAAFGAFTEISYDTKQEWKNVLGYAAYFLNALAELFQNVHYSRHLKIRIGDTVEEGDYVFGAVCNSASVAGMPLFGKAGVKQNDGKMELLLIRTPKNLIELQAIVATLRKGNPSHPGISFKQISSVIFEADEELMWTTDGEFGGSYQKTEIHVLKHAVSIMTGDILMKKPVLRIGRD